MVLPFDRIYFISLKNALGSRRRKLLFDQFEKHGITDKNGNQPEWVVASNGLKIDHHVDHEFRKRTMRKGNISQSEIGCFASHRKAWNAFSETEFKDCLILEDDALFADLLIFENWSEMPEWEMVNFGFTTNKASIVNTLESAQHPLFHGLFKGSGMWLTHAYCINQRAVNILLDNTEIQKGGLDWQLTEVQPKLKNFGFSPAKIKQQKLDFSNPTSIRHT